MTARQRPIENFEFRLHLPVPPKVGVLFPYAQLSILCSFLVLTAASTPWTRTVFVVSLLVWQVSLSLNLARESWRPRLRICSNEATLSVVAATWYGAIGLAQGVPAAAAVMALTLITLALYGWLCHESR